jgi:hypothetical protein
MKRPVLSEHSDAWGEPVTCITAIPPETLATVASFLSRQDKGAFSASWRGARQATMQCSTSLVVPSNTINGHSRARKLPAGVVERFRSVSNLTVGPCSPSPPGSQDQQFGPACTGLQSRARVAAGLRAHPRAPGTAAAAASPREGCLPNLSSSCCSFPCILNTLPHLTRLDLTATCPDIFLTLRLPLLPSLASHCPLLSELQLSNELWYAPALMAYNYLLQLLLQDNSSVSITSSSAMTGSTADTAWGTRCYPRHLRRHWPWPHLCNDSVHYQFKEFSSSSSDTSSSQQEFEREQHQQQLLLWQHQQQQEVGLAEDGQLAMDFAAALDDWATTTTTAAAARGQPTMTDGGFTAGVSSRMGKSNSVNSLLSSSSNGSSSSGDSCKRGSSKATRSRTGSGGSKPPFLRPSSSSSCSQCCHTSGGSRRRYLWQVLARQATSRSTAGLDCCKQGSPSLQELAELQAMADPLSSLSSCRHLRHLSVTGDQPIPAAAARQVTALTHIESLTVTAGFTHKGVTPWVATLVLAREAHGLGWAGQGFAPGSGNLRVEGWGVGSHEQPVQLASAVSALTSLTKLVVQQLPGPGLDWVATLAGQQGKRGWAGAAVAWVSYWWIAGRAAGLRTQYNVGDKDAFRLEPAGQ